MVKFIITECYCLKIQNRLNDELPYDISDIDPAIPPGVVPPMSTRELIINVTEKPVIDPCVKLLTLPYSYGRPVFVEFSRKHEDALSIQDIDLTEMPGFSMVENDETVDHISECGYNVKLYGGATSHICLEIWFSDAPQ